MTSYIAVNWFASAVMEASGHLLQNAFTTVSNETKKTELRV